MSAKSATPAAGRCCSGLIGKPPPNLSEGTVTILANGEQLEAAFVKIALSVVMRTGSNFNILPELLRSWFGEKAGLPGTNFHVSFRQEGQNLVMRAIGRAGKS